MYVRTSGGSCYGIGNDGPELHFVGVGRNLKIIDNRRQLHQVSNKTEGKKRRMSKEQ